MNKIKLITLTTILLTGCGSTRSISYHTGNYNYQYHGELSQLNVLSQLCLSSNKESNEGVIIAKGSKVILIQSGQMSPESMVVDKIKESLIILPFAGIPESNGQSGISWNAVAKLGNVESAIVYWGEIETGYQTKGTVAISWVPIAGWFIPDQIQRMRIKVKYLIIDISSGNWEFDELLSSESEVSTSIINKEDSDKNQIATLKSEVLNKMSMLILNKVK